MTEASPAVARSIGRGLVRFEARAMASPLRLTLPAEVPEPAALAAWTAVRAEFGACEQVMSRFRDDSEVTLLNRAVLRGDLGPLPASVRLRRALVATDRARRMTAGRFDPRVLRDLDRLGYRGAPLVADMAEGTADGAERPTDAPDKVDDPSEAPGSLGSTTPGRPVLTMASPGLVCLDAPVDLGGIGKGLALRWAAAAASLLLPEHTVGLLDAGGDIVAIGRRAPTDPWPVGIEDPTGDQDELIIVALADGAVATSSVAINRWTASDGSGVHHLIDPASGRPGGEGLLAVTVAGPDPAWSEIWSKALFLAGRRSIATPARRLGWPVWWVAEDGALEMTPAARERTMWLAREAGTTSG